MRYANGNTCSTDFNELLIFLINFFAPTHKHRNTIMTVVKKSVVIKHFLHPSARGERAVLFI